MILKAFALRDMKADNFHAPFFVPSAVQATRLLSELVQNKNSELGKYPGDFMLYEIGALDTSTGTLSALPPSEVCSVLSVLPKPDPRQIMLPAPGVGVFPGQDSVNGVQNEA